MMHGSGTAAEAKERAGFVLGIGAGATDVEALAAYQNGVATMHPRVGGDRRSYQALLAAWAVWQQLSEDASGSPMSLHQAAGLRAEGIRRDVDIEAAGDDLPQVIDVLTLIRDAEEEDVVVDIRDDVYEVDLQAIVAMPAAHRAYAVAGDRAVIRTAAGLVHEYA